MKAKSAAAKPSASTTVGHSRREVTASAGTARYTVREISNVLREEFGTVDASRA